MNLTFNKELILKFILAGFCFSFSFGIAINNIFYILLIIISILLFKKEGFKQNITNPVVILFSLYFFFILFSLVYTTNIDYGIKLILRMTPFIIFPLLIFNIRNLINERIINNCMKYFTYGVLVSSILFLLLALYNSIFWGTFNPLSEINGNFFTYFKLVSLFKLHPIYYGCFVLLSICYFSYKFYLSNFKQTIFLFLILYLTIILFMLNSFYLIGILSIFLLIIVFYIKKGLKFLVLFLVLSSFPIYKASYFIQEKFKGVNLVEDFTTKDYSGNHFTSLKARNAKANLSIKLIQENKLFGVGIGDSKVELFKMYEKHNFHHGVINEYNSHNQYLTTYIQSGLFGFVLLIGLIFTLFYQSVKNQSYYLFCFTIIVSCFMLIESNLERQNGIMFFTFFSLLLSIKFKSNET